LAYRDDFASAPFLSAKGVLAETRLTVGYLSSDRLDVDQAAIIFSLVIGNASRKVRIGISPEVPAALMRTRFSVLGAASRQDRPAE
jgi:hypothetical protein